MPMEVALAYHHPTTVVTALDQAVMDFAANLRRGPVAFRGRVREPVLLRQLLFALHNLIVTDYSEELQSWLLDPVITVHPDQVFFEAFSTDESAYSRLAAPWEAFEVEGAASYGTTNIDFTWSLRDALQGLRTSRRTLFNVGAGGFGVTTTAGAGFGQTPIAHFERKVDVPETWLKGFLQVQGALAMRPFTFDVRPVDLLNAIHFFQDNRPPGPPHGLRYELEPGQPMKLVLEPWEQAFPLKGTHYSGYARSVRVWGRRRLEALLGVLPYADRVTIGVLGRGLPHLYVCHCGQYTFTLVLSGWTRNDWSKGSAFDLLSPQAELAPEDANRVLAALAARYVAGRRELAEAAGLPVPVVEQALFELCRAGRAIIEPATRRYRLRELFGDQAALQALLAPDGRLAAARRLLDEGRVTLKSVTEPQPGQPGRKETRAVAEVDDPAEKNSPLEVIAAVDGGGRLRFGRCECAFFGDNLMSRGPCAHILAARFALDARGVPVADWPQPVSDS